MSEQEQDVVLGRFLREHGEAKRKLVAMQAEMERYQKAFTALASTLSKDNVHDAFSLTTAKRELEKLPLSEFDFSKLLEFLNEYTELRKSVTAGRSRLRDLGVDAV